MTTDQFLHAANGKPTRSQWYADRAAKDSEAIESFVKLASQSHNSLNIIAACYYAGKLAGALEMRQIDVGFESEGRERVEGAERV